MLYFGTALGSAVGGAASVVVGFERLAWVGALLIAVAVLSVNIIGRILAREARRS